MGNLFKESYADVKVPTDVLYNACEMRPFIPMSEKQKLILFAGTLDKNKALDLLLKAWASIKDKYPEWRIAVLGSGDRPYFEAMSQELGCSGTVSFKGYVVGEEKERYFHDASILCLCSYMEGFPMTVLEAWSHGIAMITTPVGGLPDVIEDGVWCGANVTILKGVTIGRGSVVAAGAVVTKSCAPYSIIGGVPAKLIRMRFTPEQILEHERLLENN